MRKGGQRKYATFRVSMSPSINSTPVSPQLCSRSLAVASPLISPHSQSTQKIVMAHPDFLPNVEFLPHPSSRPSLCPIFSLQYQETHYIWNYSHIFTPGRISDVFLTMQSPASPFSSWQDTATETKMNKQTNKKQKKIQQIQGQISELQHFQTQMLRFHHKNNQ